MTNEQFLAHIEVSFLRRKEILKKKGEEYFGPHEVFDDEGGDRLDRKNFRF